MTWSYDETDLNDSTASGRLNAVRLLVGDTDTNDQLVQDEEINFSLGQTGDNIYYAASWIASVLASKFARYADTEVDGSLSFNYSDKAKQFSKLATQLKNQGLKYSGTAFALYAGGLKQSEVEVVRNDNDRVKPAFWMDRFKNQYDQDDDYGGNY